MWFASTLIAHAGTTLQGQDGRETTTERPGFTLWAEPAPAAANTLEDLRAELDMAWEQRSQLDNEHAAARLEALLPLLRPTLDEGTGDLLADALFLQGVLELDESAGFGAPGDAVVVGGQAVPKPWVEAMAIRPTGAPTSHAEAFRKQVYEQVRTVLLTAGGTTLDLTGAGEVRIDGQVVDGPTVVLPGLHTLSWHPVGQPIEALVTDDLETLARDLDTLRFAATGQAELPEATADLLWRRVATPEVTLRDGDDSRTLRTLSPVTTQKLELALGVAAGATGWSQDGVARPDPCGTSAADGPVKLLTPIGARVAVLGDGWFAEARAGLVTGLTPTSAWSLDQPATCSDGSEVEVDMARLLPELGGALGLAWETPIGALGPAISLTTTLAHANLDLAVRTQGERVGVALFAGPALSMAGPAWRGGLELSLWQRLGT